MITFASELFESAIPEHLIVERTQPAKLPPNHVPPAKLYCARFEPAVTSFVIQYVGIQFRAGPAAEREAAVAISQLKDFLKRVNGPGFYDEAHCIDAAGYTNVIFAAYWNDPMSYAAWKDGLPSDWYYQGLAANGAVGAYLELLKPDIRDLETSFSHRHPEGLSHLCDDWSGPTLEHTYWGSMRDRIPRSQTDALEAMGNPVVELGESRTVRVTPHDNLVVIRSGQDWTQVDEAERAYYENDLAKKLDKGMAEISEGLDWGCFFQNLFTLQAGGLRLEKTYSLSMWRSLKNLEDWTTQSSKHMEIFASRIRHEGTAQGKSMIRTYHEVIVLKAADQSFEYFNCHAGTRMLRAGCFKVADKANDFAGSKCSS